MVKKVFNRIWRTFIIILNTAWNLFATVYAFAVMFKKHNLESAEQLLVSFAMIVIINVIDFVTRKHFKNY